MSENTTVHVCQTCGELVPLGCCTCGPRQRLGELKPRNPWRELWVERFDFSGDPCEEIYPGGPLERTCFFCGNQHGHCPNCIYPKVKRLLDKEAK